MSPVTRVSRISFSVDRRSRIGAPQISAGKEDNYREINRDPCFDPRCFGISGEINFLLRVQRDGRGEEKKKKNPGGNTEVVGYTGYSAESNKQCQAIKQATLRSNKFTGEKLFGVELETGGGQKVRIFDKLGGKISENSRRILPTLTKFQVDEPFFFSFFFFFFLFAPVAIY